MGTQSLTRAQARRIALAAQGFADRPHAAPTMRTLDRTLDRVGLVQIDSVNVLQRAHYLPLYSRMGPYDVDLLHRAASGRERRRLVEYWAHVQAYMPVDLWPAMAHRREHYRARRGKWSVVPEDAALEARLLREIERRGASTARELDDGLPRGRDHWGWNWSRTRRVLDYLFTTGDVAVASRTPGFEVRYDLPERVLPRAVLEAQPLPEAEAHVELVRRAARSHGVASAACLADYHRLRAGEAKAAIAELVAAGELEPVQVEGWGSAAYLHREARLPRRIDARTLLSPFDPVVWQRARTEAIFGFRYRIEIYVPAPQRVHGYYVLPFLLGDRLVGRVDLKADRAAGRLLVQAAWGEGERHLGGGDDDRDDVAPELAVELRRMAGWLGMDDVVPTGRGDLAGALADALATT